MKKARKRKKNRKRKGKIETGDNSTQHDGQEHNPDSNDTQHDDDSGPNRMASTPSEMNASHVRSLTGPGSPSGGKSSKKGRRGKNMNSSGRPDQHPGEQTTQSPPDNPSEYANSKKPKKNKLGELIKKGIKKRISNYKKRKNQQKGQSSGEQNDQAHDDHQQNENDRL